MRSSPTDEARIPQEAGLGGLVMVFSEADRGIGRAAAQSLARAEARTLLCA
ncbi:hypothetical protein [Desulfosoma caldarium]|uniref:hypothetical protein n=1 Tax=Desulfosoma caldarium TaxID=610254 RepID=UPI0014738355|nr:hypothetical protein [Desulfosoma caldarium]